MTIGIKHVNDYLWFDSRFDSTGNFRFAGPHNKPLLFWTNNQWAATECRRRLLCQVSSCSDHV